jgi:hypothetical protein
MSAQAVMPTIAARPFKRSASLLKTKKASASSVMPSSGACGFLRSLGASDARVVI